ncbi:MAG: FCD domain-containing protein [Lapillicoccus sp.]
MSLPAAFERVRPVRLSERIVDQIEARITSGELLPGQRLPSERDLVVQFGAGRSTIREALRVLEAGGLVRSRPGDPLGPEIMVPEPIHLERQLTRLATTSRMSLVELVGSRMILDAAAVRLAARLRTDDEVADMAAAVEAMEAALDGGHDAFSEADLAFHDAVARASHNALVQVCNAAVRDVVLRLVATRLSGEADATALKQLSLEHHRTVLEAIRRGDGAAAARDCTRSLFAYYVVHLDDCDRETLRALLD